MPASNTKFSYRNVIPWITLFRVGQNINIKTTKYSYFADTIEVNCSGAFFINPYRNKRPIHIFQTSNWLKLSCHDIIYCVSETQLSKLPVIHSIVLPK